MRRITTIERDLEKALRHGLGRSGYGLAGQARRDNERKVAALRAELAEAQQAKVGQRPGCKRYSPGAEVRA